MCAVRGRGAGRRANRRRRSERRRRWARGRSVSRRRLGWWRFGGCATEAGRRRACRGRGERGGHSGCGGAGDGDGGRIRG